MGKGKEHILHEKFVIRMWGRGRNMVCLRNLPLECGEGKEHVLHEKKKGKEIQEVCNHDFQRVFS